MKKKLLWIADAVVQTGFSRVTHNVLQYLKEHWELHVLGINYVGDPHPYPYNIYPAALGGDAFGVGRTKALVQRVQPDVILINQDPWNIPPYLEEMPENGPPVVAYLPIDAPNQISGRALNSLDRAIAYTTYGRKQLVLGGYMGRCDVIPHGVDTVRYRPIDKHEARKHLQLDAKLPDDAFIVGNVNRNQPRKRLDLTVQYFTQWWVNAGQPRNAYLYVHAANRDIGINFLQLSKYYGVQQQLITTNPNMTPASVMKEEDMPYIYNAFDVQISTTMGEGWGLTQHEGMACGVPQIVPDYAALGEWCKDAARLVPCTTFKVAEQGINTVGGIADADAFAAAIHELYTHPDERTRLGAAALARATESRFQWSGIADLFHAVLLETALERQAAPVGIKGAR